MEQFEILLAAADREVSVPDYSSLNTKHCEYFFLDT
jgi:hypothetical protein